MIMEPEKTQWLMYQGYDRASSNKVDKVWEWKIELITIRYRHQEILIKSLPKVNQLLQVHIFHYYQSKLIKRQFKIIVYRIIRSKVEINRIRYLWIIKPRSL